MAKKRVVVHLVESWEFEIDQPEWAEKIAYYWDEKGLWVDASGVGRSETMGFFPMSQVRAVLLREVPDG